MNHIQIPKYISRFNKIIILLLNLNERQIKILEYLVENNSISRVEYARMFRVSLRTANYGISELEKLNLINREGVGRAIRYTLK
ncbi:MAG: winged helix-turn-helix transcriptional regulator [Candidatus Humimicrobiia bacterium]